MNLSFLDFNSLNFEFFNLTNPLPIIVYLLLAFAVTRIPYLSGYFSKCNHLIHEIVSSIFAGKQKSLKTSTPQNITKENRFKKTLVTYIGQTGTSLSAIGLFYLIAYQNYNYVLYCFIGLFIIGILFWLRNVPGIIWAISFLALLALPIYYHDEIVIMHVSIFLSACILVQSIFGGIQVCRNSVNERKSQEETGFFSRIYFLPTMLFGLILFGQSLYAVYFIAYHVISLY